MGRTQRRHLLLTLLVVLSYGSACQCPTELASRQRITPTHQGNTGIVATVDGESISVEAFQRAMVREGVGDSPAEKSTLLEELIRTKVLAVAGRKAGFDRDPEVAEVVDRLFAERYLRHLSDANPHETRVSDAELRAYYEAHWQNFVPEQRARVAVIMLRFPPNPREADKDVTRGRADTILKAVRDQRDLPGSFVFLVNEHSEDPASRARGGDIGWLTRTSGNGRIEPALVDAAFALPEIGDTAVIETQQGVVLLRLTDRSPNQPRPFAEVAAEIRQRISARKAAERSSRHYQKLRDRAQVEVRSDVLATIELPDRAQDLGGPPAFPLGLATNGRSRQ